MPGFDGTGPQGNGPFTGGGRGYCAVAYPPSGRPYGYAGLQGRPIRGSGVARGRRVVGAPQRSTFTRSRGRGRGRGRGRRGRG